MPESEAMATATATVTASATSPKAQALSLSLSPAPADLKSLAEAELGETAPRRKQSLRDLRKWLSKQQHLATCRTDTDFLLRFLRFKKFDVNETEAVLDKYLLMRTQHPEWFSRLDVREPRMRDLMASGYIFVLPERDRSGRRVVFTCAASLNASRFTAAEIMRAHILLYEALLVDEENQIRGLTYVFDEAGINWSQIALFSPTEISKAFRCCERALPLRHREVHFVNLPWTMTLVFQFAKSLLSQKLRERFQTHTSFDKLAEEFPTHILPKGYGGTISTEDMVKMWMNELEAKRDALLSLDHMRYGPKEAAAATAAEPHAEPDDRVLDLVGSVRKMEVSAGAGAGAHANNSS